MKVMKCIMAAIITVLAVPAVQASNPNEAKGDIRYFEQGVGTEFAYNTNPTRTVVIEVHVVPRNGGKGYDDSVWVGPKQQALLWQQGGPSVTPFAWLYQK